MQSTDSSGQSLTTRTWWEQHRLRYNVGLVVAGVLAFICYVISVDRGISAGTMPGAEITLFTTIFQGMGYLIMMGIANLCYFAGPLSEVVLRPKNIERFRRITFGFGFWFSVLLPFTIPVAVIWSYLIPH